ncbi:MAG: polyprenol monophosphomannose synthase [Anaerolineales bacterium]|nr:MAG: polyprenol monophosphomannose synthase [Anaerolineales bacterium]
MPTDITIVLPTFNERDNIVTLIQRGLTSLSDYEVEMLVVDDDSPDGTWRVVSKLAEQDSRVRLIRRTEERGLTTAIATGIAHAKGGWIGWMDCDLSMPPEDLPRLAAALADGADLAVGSRFINGGSDIGHSWVGKAFSWTINMTASLLLERHIRDYTSGFILARRQVFDQIHLQGDYGEYCIDLLYRAARAGFRVKEIPYQLVPRKTGESKTATNSLGLVTRGWNYVLAIARLRLAKHS